MADGNYQSYEDCSDSEISTDKSFFLIYVTAFKYRVTLRELFNSTLL